MTVSAPDTDWDVVLLGIFLSIILAFIVWIVM
jgi:hypothetical protein